MAEVQRIAIQRSALAPARVVRSPQRVRHERRDTDAAPLRRMMAAGVLQPRLAIGAADDPFETEAERTADAVMTPDAAPKAAEERVGRTGLAASLMRMVRRAIGKTDPPAKKDDDDKKKVVQKESAGPGPSVVPAGIEASVDSMSAAGGAALPSSLRSQFEPRFGYDFGGVRVHTGSEAAGAATALGARAFTVGDHIFFGSGEYQPSSARGQHLIAHELTHTIQQKPAAARASRLIAPKAAFKRVQRLFDDTKAAIRNKVRTFIVRDFPPWDLITLIIGYDPIQEKSVKGATRDWIHAAMKLAPDGEALFARLDQEGKIDSVAKWWDAQVAKLDLSYASMVALVNKAWEAVGAGDILDPSAAWNKKLKPLFEPVVNRVWDFIKEVGGKILAVVKDLVLTRLGEWAQKQKGYPLLTMVLGKDPVTGEEVKPTLKGVIFAVLDLIDGGDKIKENLEKSKTIEKAAAWFKNEVKKLDLTWEGIKALFKQAWDAFKVADLLTPKILFDKMAAIFGPPVLRLLSFLLAVAKKILEFIFEGAMLIAGPIGVQIVGIVKKIGDTFNKIVEDPVAFVGHLVDAVKKGITQFAKNILDHLKTGLIEWLVGTLDGAGIVLPKVWDLKGILDLVLQILGITYAKIRVKLVKVLGEKTVSMLEKTFAFIKTLVTEGPAAAWKQIVDAIGGLWDLVIGGIKDWAITKIVTAAITKLVTMFNPAGAIIQAIIATYNTIAFFIERIKQILAFVEAVVDSVANIAMGKIAAAANWVEKAMARTIPVILGFLARLIGLGNVSDAVKKVITAIQAKVDKGIDFVIDWVVKQAKKLFGGKGDEKTPPEVASKHQDMLKKFVGRIEEDEPGPPVTDEQWLDDKRKKAQLLQQEGQAQLEAGVGLSIAIKPGSLPRQLEYAMKVAPNTTSVSGASGPPVLTVGELYTFYKDLAGNDSPRTAKFVETAKLGGRWVIKAFPPGERETERADTGKELRGKWKGMIIVPAEKPDGTPNYRLAAAAAAEPPVFRLTNSRKSARGGLQPIDVDANPLALTANATKPYQLPPGLERIAASLRSSGTWVPGHLVNGSMGGPGSNENLVPIDIGTNAKMRGNYENVLRGQLQLGKYYYFHARVDYHSGGSVKGVGHTEDFVRTISIDYEEITKNGSSWTKTGSKGAAGPYSLGVPAIGDLDPTRVNS
jgi:uncharacterized protein DUF4157